MRGEGSTLGQPDRKNTFFYDSLIPTYFLTGKSARNAHRCKNVDCLHMLHICFLPDVGRAANKMKRIPLVGIVRVEPDITQI